VFALYFKKYSFPLVLAVLKLESFESTMGSGSLGCKFLTFFEEQKKKTYHPSTTLFKHHNIITVFCCIYRRPINQKAISSSIRFILLISSCILVTTRTAGQLSNGRCDAEWCACTVTDGGEGLSLLDGVRKSRIHVLWHDQFNGSVVFWVQCGWIT
jgi:hypothetical protein